MKEKREKLRGRFQKKVNDRVMSFVASIPYDWRLFKEDITGSVAHARMLAKQKIILKEEAEAIIRGLTTIYEDIERGKLKFKPDLEDIHMNIESRLREIIGDTAGKLHTARSRNDQVALDLRLFVKRAIRNTIDRLREMQVVLLDIAEANRKVILPGYTHMQQAQPVLFAHYALAYFEMFQRDILRFGDCLERTDVLPLGSGALAGVAYNIDRDFVASQLGFSRVSANSIDAVSDRDFVMEYEAAASIAMMHLSRLAEELILWSSSEFGFIEIDDAFVTSSSIMPQKKNPDVVELTRGKTGRVYGNLVACLTMMKGLPLAYNRDMQEDKEGLFDTVDTLSSSLDVMTKVVSGSKINPERMKGALDPHILATDYADYLVSKGMPFREAHGIVSKLVLYAIKKNKGLDELALNELRKHSDLFDEDVSQISFESSVAARISDGGTAPGKVEAEIAIARSILRAKDE